ncbi:hypothetical protein NDU88_001072 [Pleurodeles waltl]|uniref:Uncharacterized protein n=1 Tax=Pleurodeles waltl TaxID=8319 RepID=A0AAV7P2N2_PLEWA|nr:hypothetical protein NDU88_001072 [Pleurodeles waltl]
MPGPQDRDGVSSVGHGGGVTGLTCHHVRVFAGREQGALSTGFSGIGRDLALSFPSGPLGTLQPSQQRYAAGGWGGRQAHLSLLPTYSPRLTRCQDHQGWGGPRFNKPPPSRRVHCAPLLARRGRGSVQVPTVFRSSPLPVSPFFFSLVRRLFLLLLRLSFRPRGFRSCPGGMGTPSL